MLRASFSDHPRTKNSSLIGWKPKNHWIVLQKKNIGFVFLYNKQWIGKKWRIENFLLVPVPSSSRRKFFTGDSYIILKLI
ncbi:hypothetical protein OPV22_014574 [Ensete ventricosum]|uniref:Uncharacterized protein n=1 Tax=Ensete ventricosum TaxID=4639 RepID=A0AAV8RA01_ENSVE|nr:hypothetical protein OPV22_014574 [Ensete ventricosum]